MTLNNNNRNNNNNNNICQRTQQTYMVCRMAKKLNVHVGIRCAVTERVTNCNDRCMCIMQ